MTAPFDWSGLQDTIGRWAHTADAQVVWGRENAPGAVKPYVALKITQAPEAISYDQQSLVYDATDDTLVPNVCGQREFVCNVQAFTSSDAPASDAASILSTLTSSLWLQSTADDFVANGLAYVDGSAITVLDDIALGEFDSRASMDVRFRIASNYLPGPSSGVGYINRVSGTGTMLPGPVVDTFDTAGA